MQFLTASWTTCFLYRRVLLACFDSVYDVKAPGEDLDMLLQVPAKAWDELLVASVLAPLAASNLRARVPARMWAMDASPSKGAWVAAPVSPELARAAWRHSERKGKYSRLETRPRQLLRAWGHLAPEEEEADFQEYEQPTSLPREYAFCYDAVFLCDGAGRVASAAAQLGLIIGPIFDLSLSPYYDLLDNYFLEFIFFMLRYRRVLFVGLAPPCTTNSPARHPALKGPRHPFGFRPSDPQTRVGNAPSLRAIGIAAVARRCGEGLSKMARAYRQKKCLERKSH